MNPLDDTPRLHGNRQTLSMSFSSSLIQSCMRLDAPDELVLDYTRTMMGALLFVPDPVEVLMIGLGGGSMLKYMHRHVPSARLTVVEIHPEVIDLRQSFHIPPDDARLRVLCDDGAHHVRQVPPGTFDLILVDGFDGLGIPDALSTPAFYRQVRAALSERGLMVANVQSDTRGTGMIRQRIDKAFEGVRLSVESDEGGNEIMLAFRQAAALDATLPDLAARWSSLDAAHRATLSVCTTRFERALLNRRRQATARQGTP